MLYLKCAAYKSTYLLTYLPLLLLLLLLLQNTALDGQAEMAHNIDKEMKYIEAGELPIFKSSPDISYYQEFSQRT